MALPNLIRSGALFALFCGCSSQSLEAVGSASCLTAQVSSASACAGAGAGGTSSTGGTATGGASGGSTGGSSGGGSTGGTTGGNAGAAGAGEPGGSLIHRYSFDGSGVVVEDSVGNADGTVVNATLDERGAVSIADDTTSGNQELDQFVDLPNQLVSTLRNATLEVWFTWAGGAPWQRILDFGDDTSGVEDNRSTGNGKTYLFVTPQTPTDKGAVLRVAFQAAQVHEVQLDAQRAVPRGIKTHVAVVVDSDAGRMLVYMNGQLENSMAFPADYLALIHDVNNWLGRSNYFYDPCFTGTFHEFRVYSAALNAAQIRESYDAGSETPVPGL